MNSKFRTRKLGEEITTIETQKEANLSKIEESRRWLEKTEEERAEANLTTKIVEAEFDERVLEGAKNAELYLGNLKEKRKTANEVVAQISAEKLAEINLKSASKSVSAMYNVETYINRLRYNSSEAGRTYYNKLSEGRANQQLTGGNVSRIEKHEREASESRMVNNTSNVREYTNEVSTSKVFATLENLVQKIIKSAKLTVEEKSKKVREFIVGLGSENVLIEEIKAVITEGEKKSINRWEDKGWLSSIVRLIGEGKVDFVNFANSPIEEIEALKNKVKKEFSLLSFSDKNSKLKSFLDDANKDFREVPFLDILSNGETFPEEIKNILSKNLLNGIYSAEKKRMNVLESYNIYDGATNGRGQLGESAFNDVQLMPEYKEMLKRLNLPENISYKDALKNKNLENFIVLSYMGLRIKKAMKYRDVRSFDDCVKFGILDYHGAKVYPFQKFLINNSKIPENTKEDIESYKKYWDMSYESVINAIMSDKNTEKYKNTLTFANRKNNYLKSDKTKEDFLDDLKYVTEIFSNIK